MYEEKYPRTGETRVSIFIRARTLKNITVRFLPRLLIVLNTRLIEGMKPRNFVALVIMSLKHEYTRSYRLVTIDCREKRRLRFHIISAR